LKIPLAATGAVVILLLGLIGYLTMSPTSSVHRDASTTEPQAERITNSRSQPKPVSDFSDSLEIPPLAKSPDSVESKSPSPEKNAASTLEKTTILLGIQDSIATYSDEGVDQIAPLLASPDPQIRDSAIDGMKQLATPKAAAVLREAAMKSTTSAADRAAMLEAAEFIDLPPYEPKKAR
jgi:hypothetical protein